mgnify:CR=1 FL=1
MLSTITYDFRFDGSDVSEETNSTYGHQYTSIGNYLNLPLVVGGYNDDIYYYNNNNKVEIWSNSQWEQLGDFPFVTEEISAYSFVTISSELFLFGTSILSFQKCLFI